MVKISADIVTAGRSDQWATGFNPICKQNPGAVNVIRSPEIDNFSRRAFPYGLYLRPAAASGRDKHNDVAAFVLLL